MKFKITASNPSEFNEQTVSVKSYLPKGIQPENVIDAGGLEIGYDVKQGQCYVHREVVLAVKASVTYVVEIDDIWLMDGAALEKQRAYARQLRNELQDSEYAEVAGQLTEGIEQKIESILEKQEENSIDKVTPIKHIGAYEFNQQMSASIAEDIRTLENMVIALLKGGTAASFARGRPAAGDGLSAKEAVVGADLKMRDAEQGSLDTGEGYILEEVMTQLNELGKTKGGGCIAEEALRYARDRNISLKENESMLLSVGAENPSETEGQTVPVKYYFNEEVKANDVLDSGGLKVGFDFEKSLYYVFKDDVSLQPAEKKTFEVKLKNKWIIDKFYLFTLKVHTDDMAMVLRGQEGFETARQMNEDIQEGIDSLLERKGSLDFTEEYTASFRRGEAKLKEIEKNIEKMEDWFVKTGVVPAMTSQQKEELCEEARGRKTAIEAAGGGEGSEMMKEFKLVAGTIFKGKSPATVVTWRIIYGIVIFLGVLSSTFYYVQIKAHRSTMLDALTGVFSRAYITERFREELRIARETKTKCSLLVMDVDKFKTVNDTYGHAVGDIILKEFVIAMRKGVRATDLVGRFGGDEFLIILPTGSKDMARKIAEGIVRLVEKHKIHIKDQAFGITTSMGVATFPDDSGTADDMFNKADGALYETKRRGGNGVTVV